jgi:hypothetical protein
MGVTLRNLAGQEIYNTARELATVTKTTTVHRRRTSSTFLDNAEAIILDVTAVGSSEQCLDHLLSVNSFGQVVPEVFLVRKEDGKRNTVVDNTPHALRHGNRGHDMIRDQLTMIFPSVRNVTQYAAGPLLLNNGLIYCEPVAVFC